MHKISIFNALEPISLVL